MTNKIRHPEKVNKPINPIKKKPDWIRSKLSNSKEFFLTKTVVNQNNLVTVCQEANCPNITECWSKRHATFMIMGDTCTRACAFCDVKTGKPESLDPFEPSKISNAVNKLNLKHVVITSVDRDDLEDGGPEHFYNVITATRKKNPNTSIEVLTPDFLRKGDAYKKLLEADLDVFNHNIETVLTSYSHERATERAEEVLKIYADKGDHYDYVLLLQGDEPQIDPDDIDALDSAIKTSANCVVNLIHSIEGNELKDPNVVKAILDLNGNILYFSRALIPYNTNTGFRQLGMIGFTSQILQRYCELDATPLEITESIDMMRFLENDIAISSLITDKAIIGVDHPEDIQKVEQQMQDDELMKEYKFIFAKKK